MALKLRNWVRSTEYIQAAQYKVTRKSSNKKMRVPEHVSVRFCLLMSPINPVMVFRLFPFLAEQVRFDIVLCIKNGLINTNFGFVR